MLKVMRGNTREKDRQQANIDISNETERKDIYKYFCAHSLTLLMGNVISSNF